MERKLAEQESRCQEAVQRATTEEQNRRCAEMAREEAEKKVHLLMQEEPGVLKTHCNIPYSRLFLRSGNFCSTHKIGHTSMSS